jgi:hypothetical protein
MLLRQGKEADMTNLSIVVPRITNQAVRLGLAALFLTTAFNAAAQNAKPAARSHAIRRTADGHPDLQGVYDVATLTQMERLPGVERVLTKEQATAVETAVAQVRAQADQPLKGERAAPPAGGESVARTLAKPENDHTGFVARFLGLLDGGGGKVGGYNVGWLDPGSGFAVVNGEKRSSMIVDPADGKVPPVIGGAAKRMAGLQGRPTSDALESRDPDLDPTPGAYDNPERRPLGERCLLGFGSTSGPPILPNYFYNNLHQIVQTPHSIMILTEMVHDARIIRMNAQHLPKNIRLWMGDSVGHWEGDTLVVDTTNFTDKTRFRGSTENLHVVERLTRVDDNTLLYRFTIDDPQTWTRPWTGEYTWPVTHANLYEYACHEGNYALTDILKGARLREKEAVQSAAKSEK